MVKCRSCFIFAAWIAFSCNKPINFLFASFPEHGIRFDNRYLACPENYNKSAVSNRNRNGFQISLRLRGGSGKEAGSLASPVLRGHFIRGHVHHGSEARATQDRGIEAKTPVDGISQKESDSDANMEDQPWFRHAANDEGNGI